MATSDPSQGMMMSTELANLVAAWKVCFSGAIASTGVERQAALQHIEAFKQSSPLLLDAALYLAAQNESCEMAHFGVQLLVSAVKMRWNEYDEPIKALVKTKLMSLLGDSSGLYLRGPNYLKNALGTAIIELLKREWPQHWPQFLDQLASTCNTESLHESKRMVFTVMRLIAEEFILDVDANMSTQRRKDIVQYMNANMLKIACFFIDNLELLLGQLQQQSQQSHALLIDVTHSCLQALNSFMSWLSLPILFSRSQLLVRILLALLAAATPTVSDDAALCLVTLITGRKGSLHDRQPLLVLFDAQFLHPIMECISKALRSTDSPTTGCSLKRLIAILVGIGTQLAALWQAPPPPSATTAAANTTTTTTTAMARPDQLTPFINSVLELIFCSNR